VLAFELLAEQRINEALAKGELSGLPGSGQPLDLADDLLVPEDQRLAQRILKNAGYTPPEVGLRREIAELRTQLELLDESDRGPAWQRLSLLMSQLSLARGAAVNLSLEDRYWQRLKERFAASPTPAAGGSD
jgi:hypothetical protein